MGHHNPAFDKVLAEYAAEMEELLGRELEPGYGKATCRTLAYDRADMWHRSLTWYRVGLKRKHIDLLRRIKLSFLILLLVYICRRYDSIWLSTHCTFDFYRGSLTQSVFPLRPLILIAAHRSPAKALTYWHQPHTATRRLPVLFVHGIGIGLYPYINFLADLKARDGELCDGQVGIIAVELMSVSSRITRESLPKEAMCGEVDCVVKAHRWEKSVLVSHSYVSPRPSPTVSFQC